MNVATTSVWDSHLWWWPLDPIVSRPLAAFGLCSLIAACAEPAPQQPSPKPQPLDTATIVTAQGGGGSTVDYAKRLLDQKLATLNNPSHSNKIRLRLLSEGIEKDLARYSLVPPEQAESFVAFSPPDRFGETWVIGRDANGLLYGALELLDRLDDLAHSTLPLAKPIKGAPQSRIRGLNHFVHLPVDGERDYYFHNESFWIEYLDILAKGRYNYLDLHGMYNDANTGCPNMLPYFAESKSFPDVGLTREEKARNVEALNTIIRLATERGIHVGVMTYHTSTSLTLDDLGAQLDEGQLQQYTREAVSDLLFKAPGLWRFGFRIGESGRDADWFARTAVQSLNESAPFHQLSTRTWLTNKPQVLSLLNSTTRDILVETKYNGEQSGPPYPIAGGLMTMPDIAPTSYSYEDYLDPPSPSTFVFHIWTGGTNRVFRYASYDRIKRTVQTTTMSSANGFSMMPPHAFYPQYNFYHKSEKDWFSPWSFRRDELQMLMFGRLGYDSAVPEDTFRRVLAARLSTDALWRPLQAVGEIIPWIQSAHTCGADHRWSAPEMEWNGPVGFWASPSFSPDTKKYCGTLYHGPFDTFAVASPYEAATNLVQGVPTTKLSPVDVAHIVLRHAHVARTAGQVKLDGANAEARDVAREAVAVSWLGEYFGHKLLAATALAVFEQSAQNDYLLEATRETANADAAWQHLASSTEYLATIREPLRMGGRLGFLRGYHWKMQDLASDPISIQQVADRVLTQGKSPNTLLPEARQWLATEKTRGPGLSEIAVTTLDNEYQLVRVSLRSSIPRTATVRLLYKPLSNLQDWKVAAMEGDGVEYSARVKISGHQAIFATEVLIDSQNGYRYPNVLEQTPYVIHVLKKADPK